VNRKELIAAVAGKAGVAEADTDKVLAGTAAIFVGRTTTTGATNPSSHRCPAASRQAPFGRTHRSPRSVLPSTAATSTRPRILPPRLNRTSQPGPHRHRHRHRSACPRDAVRLWLATVAMA